MKKIIVTILISAIVSCQPSEQKSDIDKEYLAKFTEVTMEGLAYNRPFYLQLISFDKLDPMTPNRFGGADDVEYKLEVEGMPPIVGSMEVFQDSILFKASVDTEVKTEEDSVITEMILEFDEFGNTLDLYHDRFSWRVVSYGQDKYLRVRDLESPNFKEFKGYQRFELTPDFIFQGRFKPYDSPKKIVVPSNVNFERTATFIGTITFDYEGESFEIQVGDGHIMFSDGTSAGQTYGSGRYVKFKPEEDGSVILDFNYAYNPPCSFSDYTTCLFPPAQNRLPFKIMAGETTERI
ncbi:MAG: DUF1684 domain-containing protein [Cyclobacteriaceae bacterium]